MTVSTTVARQYFNGDGSNKIFPFNFEYFSAPQIVATKILTSGATVPLVLTTDYTLTNANVDAGGILTMVVAPGVGERLIVQRVLPLTQTTSIRNQGAFFPEIHEDVFDYLTMLIQQVKDGDLSALHLNAAQTSWDALGLQIKNLAQGTAGTDAVTVQQVIDQIAAVTGDIVNTNNIYYMGQPLTTFLGTVLTANSTLDPTKISHAGTTLPLFLRGSNAFTVDTIAALKAFDTTVGRRAYVLGYAAPGDGGGGMYWLDTADTTTADNGGTVIAPAVTASGRWKLDYPGNRLSVKQFGAKGNNSTNDRAAIQACIDAVAVKGGIVYLPAGQYRIGSGIGWTANGVTLQGDGPYATQIIATFATGNVIAVGSAGTNPNQGQILDLLISSTVTRTSGAGIYFENGHNLQARNIRSEGQYYHMQMEGGAQQYLYTLENFEFNNGFRGLVTGTLPTVVVQDIFVSNGSIAACSGAGMYFDTFSGLYVDKVDCISCLHAVQTLAGPSRNCVAAWFNNVLADTCSDMGWNVQSNGGIVASWHLVDCWAATCGQSNANADGMRFNAGSGTMRNISLVAPQILVCGGNGLTVAGIVGFTCTNPNIYSNSFAAINTKQGIEVNAGMTGWSIEGGRIGTGAVFDTTARQQYGIRIGAGCDQFVVSGVALVGNVTGNISNLSTPADGAIANSPGYLNKNQGVALISVGQGSVVVNHGLSVTPSAKNVSLTAATNPGVSGITGFYPNSFTATQFTISLNTTVVAAPLFIAWTINAEKGV